jgi:hypothetical protein
MSDRDDVPAAVELELRRTSGYGCCRCGNPVIHYHHIILNSVEAHNRPSDMMVLCPGCHDMATKGRFTLPEQREFQSSPINIQRGYVDGLLTSHQAYPGVQVGGVLIVGEGPLVTTDDETLLALGLDAQGRLLISMVVKNEADDVLAIIQDNVWISGSPELFDLQADYQKLKINYRFRGIALEIDARGEPLQLRGRLWHNGALLDLRTDGVTWFHGGGLIDLGLAGFAFHLNSATKSVQIKPYGEFGMLVSEPDPLQRLLKTREAFEFLPGR